MKSLSHVWHFATPWTIAYQAPPSMGFSRQEYWSGLPFPSPYNMVVPCFPGGSEGKASARLPAMWRPGFDSWVGKIPWGRKWQSTPALLPGKSHGRRSLVRLQSMGSQRVGHDWSTSLSLSFTFVRMYVLNTYVLIEHHID